MSDKAATFFAALILFALLGLGLAFAFDLPTARTVVGAVVLPFALGAVRKAVVG